MDAFLVAQSSQPPRPVNTYVDPADRVASTKVAADDIKTWPVSEIDKKGKKKKGTLGVGNGAVFFASEADKVCSLLSDFHNLKVRFIRRPFKSGELLLSIVSPSRNPSIFTLN